MFGLAAFCAMGRRIADADLGGIAVIENPKLNEIQWAIAQLPLQERLILIAEEIVNLQIDTAGSPFEKTTLDAILDGKYDEAIRRSSQESTDAVCGEV